MDCGSCQCRSEIGAFSVLITLGIEAVYAGTRMVPRGASPFSVRIVVTVLVMQLQNKRGERLLFPKADIQAPRRPLILRAANGQK